MNPMTRIVFKGTMFEAWGSPKCTNKWFSIMLDRVNDPDQPHINEGYIFTVEGAYDHMVIIR